MREKEKERLESGEKERKSRTNDERREASFFFLVFFASLSQPRFPRASALKAKIAFLHISYLFLSQEPQLASLASEKRRIGNSKKEEA